MKKCYQCSFEAKTKGLCRRCYNYQHQMGKPCPAKLINDYDSNGHLSDEERIARAKQKVRDLKPGKF